MGRGCVKAQPAHFSEQVFTYSEAFRAKLRKMTSLTSFYAAGRCAEFWSPRVFTRPGSNAAFGSRPASGPSPSGPQRDSNVRFYPLRPRESQQWSKVQPIGCLKCGNVSCSFQPATSSLGGDFSKSIIHQFCRIMVQNLFNSVVLPNCRVTAKLKEIRA